MKYSKQQRIDRWKPVGSVVVLTEPTDLELVEAMIEPEEEEEEDA